MIAAILHRIEAVLQALVEGGTGSKAEPLDLVREIERELDRHAKAFVGEQTYVPHAIVVHLRASTAAQLEEYAALFTSRGFRAHIDEYVRTRGYRLLARLTIDVKCHREPLAEFKGRNCFVECSWSRVAAGASGEEAGRADRVEAPVSPPQPAIAETPDTPGEAWLEVVEGEAEPGRVQIERAEFHIGRAPKVFDHRTRRLLRVNHLAFARAGWGDVVNRSVSRLHASVHCRKGRYYLCDSGSEQGTFVVRDGASIEVMPGATPGVELRDGDVLALGLARVGFHLGLFPAKETREFGDSSRRQSEERLRSVCTPS